MYSNLKINYFATSLYYTEIFVLPMIGTMRSKIGHDNTAPLSVWSEFMWTSLLHWIIIQDAFSERKMFKYFVGVCLYLSKKSSELVTYDCTGFKSGCPEKQYWSSSIYRCKHDILSLYQLNAFFFTNDQY